jgi:hypothetical protein
MHGQEDDTGAWLTCIRINWCRRSSRQSQHPPVIGQLAYEFVPRTIERKHRWE